MLIEKNQGAFRLTLGAVCVGILCVLLTAGLWPFCAPRNGVAWVAGTSGLRFGANGIVASAQSFHAPWPGGNCTLEILLQPAWVKGSGTILAFDSSPHPKPPFVVQQLWEDMVIQRAGRNAEGTPIRQWVGTNGVFQPRQRTLLTITGSPASTLVYVNGSLAKVSSSFGLNSNDLTGRLLLGSSTFRGSWAGQITGLAIYDSALSPEDVQAHYRRWLRSESPLDLGEQQPAALYRFTEGSGNMVRDLSGHGNDLDIPSRYFALHPPFLASPLDEFFDRWSGWRTWHYWANVCLNVAGFVPMGFFFTAFFSLVRPLPRARIAVVAMGLAVSLTIEIGQHFLPTRDSGINDLITNTFGTAIGVVLCSPALMRRFAPKETTASSAQAPS
jgi:hypothetical protein